MLASLLLLVAFARAAVSDRAELVAENLVLRQQLAVLTRPTRKRPRLRRGDKVFWAVVRRLWRRWSQHLAVVRPETVLRWHRQGWRLFWRWRSRPRLGRPRLSAEVRGLIAAMARDNPRWGSERIRGELLKLGHTVAATTVQTMLRRDRVPPAPRRAGLAWPAFLRARAAVLLACDCFCVETVRLQTLNARFFFEVRSRRVTVAGRMAHPTAARRRSPRRAPYQALMPRSPGADAPVARAARPAFSSGTAPR